ncbi:TPA: capsid protein, partial [Clostridioides difficile]|nr:capsid protein [Clostridioides difficile]HBF5143150.1 capsid protein [Clostridioides difficile]
MAALNYAKEYSNVLAQAYPYTLNFGDLYATPNNGRYRWTGSKTIEIPTISTTGRVDSNRDTIAVAQRNYDNAWEPKVLTNQRKWSTLVHPADINQTNYVASIGNITKVYNEEQKFPEMDAYCISKIYADWTALGN